MPRTQKQRRIPTDQKAQKEKNSTRRDTRAQNNRHASGCNKQPAIDRSARMDSSKKKKRKTQQSKKDRNSKTVGMANKIQKKWRKQTEAKEVQEKYNRFRSA